MLKSMLFLSILTFLCISPLGSQTHTVTTTTDSGPGSFRAVVDMATTGDTIVFSPATNNTPIVLTSGEILIDKDLVIIGNSESATILSGSNTQRILNIYNCQVKLFALQCMNGHSSSGGGAIVSTLGNIQLSAVTFDNNFSQFQGGALLSTDGTVTIENSNFTNNEVDVNLNEFGGGAIANFGGPLTIDNSTFENNSLINGGIGGALLKGQIGNLIINGSTFQNNQCQQSGGAIADNSGPSSQNIFTNTNIINNSAAGAEGAAGGILLADGDLLLQDCTISGNTATLQGGGIWMATGNLQIENTLINNNSTSNMGGGIFNSAGTLQILNGSSLTGNATTDNLSTGGACLIDLNASVNIQNSDISNNTAGQAGAGIAILSAPGTQNSMSNTSIDNNSTSGAQSAAGGILLAESDLLLQNCTISGNSSTLQGGGIWMGAGTLQVDNTLINNNSTGDMGGGIFNSAGTLQIQNGSSLTGNEATDNLSSGGGCLIDLNASFSIQNSDISNNTAGQAGAGIAILSATGTQNSMSNTSIDNNSTSGPESAAGGILLADSDLLLQNCTISGNTSSLQGGGIWMAAGNLEIDNSLINNNSTADMGGGIFNSAGTLQILNGSSLSDNAASGAFSTGGGCLIDLNASVNIQNSDISNNTAGQAGAGIAILSATGTQNSMSNTSIDNNSTSGTQSAAGGLLLADGDLLLQNCTISGNTAIIQGGGIWMGAGILTVDRTFVQNNKTVGSTNGSGGGIYNDSGELVIDNSDFNMNEVLGQNSLGGAIFVAIGGDMAMEQSTISNNSASFGGGLVCILNIQEQSYIHQSDILQNIAIDSFGDGGGILLYGEGIMEITESVVSDNEAHFRGGGIWSSTDSLLIAETSINNNSTSGFFSGSGGGGVYHSNGNLGVKASTLSNNQSMGTESAGAGIFMGDPTTTIVERSTISNNHSTNAGGGIYNSGNTAIIASTIAQNTSMNTGGGLYQDDLDPGSAIVTETWLRSSIIAENISNGSGDNFYNANDLYKSYGFNLAEYDELNVFDAIASDIEGSPANPEDAVLGPLAHNGGSTQTHRITCESPAVNQGDPSLEFPDQRGEAIYAGIRDIGSFEYQDSCATTSVKSNILKLQNSRIYPNPLYNGQLTIEIDHPIPDGVRITITNIQSDKAIYKEKTRGRKTHISLSHLPAGSYFVRLHTKSDVMTHFKLVVINP